MGLQLPPELSGVAAQAGVTWPQADEDHLREQANAWRDAGTKLTHLTRDADHTANGALSKVRGSTGDAARRHWSTFVAPDTGHLTATARGCHAAADRLDHCANQVSAAKVEIVRNLVSLAKHSDAAHSAAGAGHPTALLGLDTLVRATNANVNHITSTLATAVVPATGVDVGTSQPLVNAHPGQHNGLLQTITDPNQGLVAQTTNVVAGTTHGVPDLVAGTGQAVLDPHHGAVAQTVQGATGVVADAGPAVADPLPGLGPDPVRHGVDGPGPGHPDITGPVRIPGVDAGPGHVHLDAPTPPTGIPAAPGQTVQAGFAGGLLDPGAPAGPAPAGGYGGSAGGGAPGIPGQGFTPGGGGLPAGPAAPPAAGAPAAPVGPVPGSAIPAAPARPGGPGPTFAPGGGAAPVAPGSPPGATGSGVPRPAEPVAPTRAGLAPGPLTTAAPQGQQPVAAQQVGSAAAGERRPDGPLLFWMHMFPIGHMPVVSDRPARQLPAPEPELDFAAGLRFPPGDHPEHGLVAGTPADRRPARPSDGLPAADPAVQALASGHDPLGGQHERDWDRRYLVRLGSVTPHGISDVGREYAWPPGESCPEGGTAAGEPEILAVDTVIDRFGSPEGRVFSADGTPFARRSLPPELIDSGYRRYRVVKPLPAWRAVSAPWFGQPGGGERYRTTCSAAELVALGYLVDVTGGAA